MDFVILGSIDEVKVIAVGHSIREFRRLVRNYGVGRWRKLKGRTVVKLSNGKMLVVELHWYEAHGIGRKEFKIKRIIEIIS